MGSLKQKEVKSSLHISMPSKMLERFNYYTDELGVSRNHIITDLVEEWLEDQRDIKLIEQSLKELEDGQDEIISHADFKEKLKEINNG